MSSPSTSRASSSNWPPASTRSTSRWPHWPPSATATSMPRGSSPAGSSAYKWCSTWRSSPPPDRCSHGRSVCGSAAAPAAPIRALRLHSEAVVQGCPPAAGAERTHGDRERLHRADQHHELLRPRDRGVEEVALQHHPRARGQGDDDRRIFAALRSVNRHGVRVGQLVELVEGVLDL